MAFCSILVKMEVWLSLWAWENLDSKVLYRNTAGKAGSDLQVDQLLKVALLASITGIKLFICPFIEKGEEKRLDFYKIYMAVGTDCNTWK